MMLVLLASCGSAHRRGSATAQSVSRTPSYAKPRVDVVGRAHRPQAKRHVRRHPNMATDASSTPLTHAFRLGTQTICCRAGSSTG
jgi:hypothetical protein